MTAAVICPGPSMRLYEPAGYSLIVGVNRAPLILWNDRQMKCDCWTFTDLRISETYPLPYKPFVFTTEATLGRLDKPLTYSAAKSYEAISHKWEHKTGWRLYSALAALVLCAELGSRRIDLYGADMHGTADADGHEYDFHDESAKRTRNPERWVAERINLQQVEKLLKDRGCEVIKSAS